MSFISYAQNFEDIMLWRALKHVDKGFYIDVGANDPTIDSVTLAFYERGWRGINIEPMAQYFDRLVANRPGDINLPVAIGEAEGELTFFDIHDTGLSTIDPAIAQQHIASGREVMQQQVPVTTLARICEQYAKEPIHFLKIDVEGLEGAVIRGMDLRKWRPWILVIEATKPQSQITSHDEWEHLVLQAAYRFAYFDGLNHYYVAEEHAALMTAFKLPPNVFDDFCLRSGHAYSYPLTEFEARAHQGEVRAHQAEVHAHEAELRAQFSEVKAAEAEAQARFATALREQAQAEARQAQAEARQAQAEARQAQAEARHAEGHARHAEAQTQAAEMRRQQLEGELAALYMSLSWRITKPLRELKRMARKALGRC